MLGSESTQGMWPEQSVQGEVSRLAAPWQREEGQVCLFSCPSVFPRSHIFMIYEHTLSSSLRWVC